MVVPSQQLTLPFHSLIQPSKKQTVKTTVVVFQLRINRANLNKNFLIKEATA